MAESPTKLPYAACRQLTRGAGRADRPAHRAGAADCLPHRHRALSAASRRPPQGAASVRHPIRVPMPRDIVPPPLPATEPDRVTAARQDRAAFLFGALLVYLIGLVARAIAFTDPVVGVEFSLIVDTVALLLVLANRPLLRLAGTRLGGAALTAYILASASVSSCLVILFTRLLGAALPAMATPWAGLPSAQFVYFAYLFIAWAVAGRWLEERARASADRINAIAARNAVILAEMQKLRMQLSPHFLFNTLNMLAVDIQDRPRRALLVLRELNLYLRYTLDNAERTFLPVGLEVAGLRSFMRIQQMRYGGSLKSRIDVEGSLRGHRVPTFLLQPLVENATKHGIPAANKVLTVTVRLVADAAGLTVSVSNDGDLAAAPAAPGTGTGLANLRRRLALHYPDRHSLTLEQQADRVVARLVLRGEPC
jgi:two-component system LytT family sensor kinase